MKRIWKKNSARTLAKSKSVRTAELKTCIREIPGLNLGRDVDNSEVIRGLPHSFQTCRGFVFSSPSTHFLIYLSLIIPPLDVA